MVVESVIASGFGKMWNPKTFLAVLACALVSSAADMNGEKIDVHFLSAPENARKFW